MTPEQFAEWLMGFVDLTDASSVVDWQWAKIKEKARSVVFPAPPAN